jgi:hypothetical protein
VTTKNAVFLYVRRVGLVGTDVSEEHYKPGGCGFKADEMTAFLHVT